MVLDLKNTTIFKERIENLKEINEEIIISRAVMEPKKLLNVISKQKNKNLKTPKQKKLTTKNLLILYLTLIISKTFGYNKKHVEMK